MRALDLCCKAGGASMGLKQAGFDEVVGMDLDPQPNYLFEFVQGDALALPNFYLASFDFIWASPPCQANTSLKSMYNAKAHTCIIEPMRAMLIGCGVPWAMENVVGAPLINPVRLCGTMFGLGVEDAELRRHRLIEASFKLAPTSCAHGSRDVIGIYGGHVRNRRRVRTIGVYGEGCRDSRRKFDKGFPDFTVEQGRVAMGIDWMTTAELSQAIPPAYSKFVAESWMATRHA